MLKGCRVMSFVGEFVAVDVVEEEEPDADRLDGWTLCFRGEAGVGTRGGGRGQSPAKTG